MFRNILPPIGHPYFLILLLSLALYLLLALPGLDKPLLYDEVDFAKAGEAVARTGRPLYSRGWIYDYPRQPDSGHQYQFALYHPPLYIFTLGGVFALFGPSEAAARAVGLAGGAVTIVLVYGLGRALFAAPGVAALAALMLGLSPYAIQSALLLDIDGALLTPLVLSFLYLYVRGRRLAAAVVLALALWAKLTTPPVLALGIGLYYAARRRWPEVATLAAVAAGGLTLFLSSWLAVALALDLPWQRPLADALYAVASSLDSPGPAHSLGEAVGYHGLRASAVLFRLAQWLHPALLVLLAASVAPGRGGLTPGISLRTPAASDYSTVHIGTRTRAAARVPYHQAERATVASTASDGGTQHATPDTRQLDGVRLLALLVILVSAVYLVRLAAGFPKYQIAVYPLMALLVAAGGQWWVGTPTRRRAALAGAAAAAAALVGLVTRTDGLLYYASPAAVAIWLAAAAAPFGLARRVGTGVPYLLGLGLLLGANAATAAGQATADYATTYFYGTRGWPEAGAQLRAFAGPEELVIADREVAYYAQHDRFVDTERVLAPGTALSRAPAAPRPPPAAGTAVVVRARPDTPPVPAEPIRLAVSRYVELWRAVGVELADLRRSGDYALWQAE